MSDSKLLVRRLGLLEYEPVWRAMQTFTDQRDADTADELWLVEHPPVFTQGQAGRAEHVLAPGDIPVIQVDRGGQVTYHGPGQIVAYPLIDISRLKLGVRALVSGIEQAIIGVLKSYDVDAGLIAGAPGVYVDGAKIASLGLRIRRGKSFHGLAFNIDMDLEPFQRINPCGFEGLQVTNLSAFTGVSMAEVENRLIAGLCEVLGYNNRLCLIEGGLP
ncbi:MAG: lipoyl(octanoyl) transferase LipB [Xanthomonadales bacterium]|jgi:lipoyl(octanoyl) transferase|nr:lipoyl(octanoyl) transferase LipB [Xanthomonadales bacterium]MDH4019234.1 lipoyl(octanoyl) transferase LipB [Xanthomonadales bacterium]